MSRRTTGAPLSQPRRNGSPFGFGVASLPSPIFSVCFSDLAYVRDAVSCARRLLRSSPTFNAPPAATQNDDNNFKCTKCGQVIQRAVAPPVQVSDLGDSAAMRMMLPVGRSGLAIAAGYAGLFGFLVLPAPLALVLGILAIRDLRNNPKKHGMGRAVFGLIVGLVGTALLVYVAIDLI